MSSKWQREARERRVLGPFLSEVVLVGQPNSNLGRMETFKKFRSFLGTKIQLQALQLARFQAVDCLRSTHKVFVATRH